MISFIMYIKETCKSVVFGNFSVLLNKQHDTGHTAQSPLHHRSLLSEKYGSKQQAHTGTLCAQVAEIVPTTQAI